MPHQPWTAIPTFETAAEEGGHRKRCLAAAFRIFADFGFSQDPPGHITARDCEHPELLWVNPFLMHSSLIRAPYLISVDARGHPIEADGPINTAAATIQAAVHEARADVVAAAHAHSVYGKAWSSMDRLLDSITQYACRFYGDPTLFNSYTGVVLEAEEGKRLAHALAGYKALILRNHGLLTVDGSVHEVAWWFVTMEGSCQAQLAAEAVGTPIRMEHDVARATQRVVESRQAGCFAIQSLYGPVVRSQPDLLD